MAPPTPPPLLYPEDGSIVHVVEASMRRKGARRILLPLPSHSPTPLTPPPPPLQNGSKVPLPLRERELTEKKKRGDARLPLAQRQRAELGGERAWMKRKTTTGYGRIDACVTEFPLQQLHYLANMFWLKQRRNVWKPSWLFQWSKAAAKLP